MQDQNRTCELGNSVPFTKVKQIVTCDRGHSAGTQLWIINVKDLHVLFLSKADFDVFVPCLGFPQTTIPMPALKLFLKTFWIDQA